MDQFLEAIAHAVWRNGTGVEEKPRRSKGVAEVDPMVGKARRFESDINGMADPRYEVL
jgi:hypothetical protein